MKRVFICSPFGGKQENLEKAKQYCRQAFEEGFIPFAPHLLYPQFLKDEASEREFGIMAGRQFMRFCDELWYFGDKITDGMKEEITFAALIGIPTKYRKV